ncbi:MAG TPA: hypothetical protein VFF28_01195 [Candidatus Nanoarchaeia archaeon]|nr:hypothetical protein [Candidatus Nanoarchaeia archaeon]
MIGFNADGSIRLPDHLKKRKEDTENLLKNGRCMHIRKEIVSYQAPKKCLLKLKLSDKITDNRFIDYIDKNTLTETPVKFLKVSDKEFNIEVGTNFRRCSDCTKIISLLREFIHVIEDSGSCTYQRKDFCYEDHFD